jgi:uncharacterized protein (TIGR03435 family)
MRALAYAVSTTLIAGALPGQTDNPPKFDIADVHVSAKTTNAFVRNAPPRNGRYEIKNGTMLDLVRIAYGFDPDKILEGPNWLELDRFDVIAKIPARATADDQKAMLQALLEDRFKLVVRKETKLLPTWALTAGKQPHLKEADGSGNTGCKPQADSGPPPAEGTQTPRLFMGNPDGTTTTISIGPGGTIQFQCRNMTMAAFAEGLRNMLVGPPLGNNPVLDETGLKGSWNFDVKWSIGLIGLAMDGSQISVADAIDKQLGLKLEQRQTPTPVIVVVSANRTPSANPPGLAEALPAIPAPTEFEVADVKLASPDAAPGLAPMMMRMMPGGRFVSNGMPMRFLISRAFNANNNEQIAGLPSWVDTVKLSITAKAPDEAVTGPGLDQEALAPMMRALLADRFKMTYHTEERPMSAYSLVSAKPKMKKADPTSRIFCRLGAASAGSPPGSATVTCQNATMALFAERLQSLAPGLEWPVLDATGIEGAWDFTLTFSRLPPAMNRPGRGGDQGVPGGEPAASDPGGGYTIFEAIEKQLGLKLQSQKRPMPVFVIDHIEQKPTDN